MMQIDIKIKHDVALALFIIQVLEFQTTFSLGVQTKNTSVQKAYGRSRTGKFLEEVSITLELSNS